MQKPSEIARQRPLVFQNVWYALPAGVRLMLDRDHGACAPAAGTAPVVVPPMEQLAANQATPDGMIVIPPVAHRRAS